MVKSSVTSFLTRICVYIRHMFCLHSESFARNKNVWKLQAACCSLHVYRYILYLAVSTKRFFIFCILYVPRDEYICICIYNENGDSYLNVLWHNNNHICRIFNWDEILNQYYFVDTHACKRWCPSKFHTNIQKPNSHHLYIGFVLVFATFNSYGVCLCVFLYHLSISLFSYRIWINWSANRFWIVYIST